MSRLSQPVRVQCMRLLLSILVLAAMPAAAHAQRRIGLAVDCGERRPTLLAAGYLPNQNLVGRGGVAVQAIRVFVCDAGRRDGIEAGVFVQPYYESRVDPDRVIGLVAAGSGTRDILLGAVTQRAPGRQENFHIVLGAGLYNSQFRRMYEYEESNGASAFRSDESRNKTGAGGSVGFSFLASPWPGRAIHLEFRDHLLIGRGTRRVLSAGILF